LKLEHWTLDQDQAGETWFGLRVNEWVETDTSGRDFGSSCVHSRLAPALRMSTIDSLPETVTREQQAGLLLLDIVLTGATMRFQVEADKFLFNYLGDRKTGNPTANFTLLVRDLLTSAPNALLNRGAFFLREEPPTFFEYPSKNAYTEEMTWLLWRAANAAGA
jgi:hypothetical protein